ncbi:MAG: hypothetical protein NT029_02860 [Armatimonadetes bacterium]|nr:hypothetical protein [Armatimonadota bacterium]
MRRSAAISLALLGLAGPALQPPATASGAAGPTVTEAWEALSRSLRSVALTGEKLVITTDAEGGLRVLTRRVAQASDGRSLQTTLKPRAEKGGFACDDGVYLRTYDIQNGSMLVRRSLQRRPSHSAASWKLNLAKRSYNLVMEGVERVAGRTSLRLALDPYSRTGLTIRVWLDRASGAELRREEFDPAGNSVHAEMFTSVSILPPGRAPAVSCPRPRRARLESVIGIRASNDLHELSRRASFHVRVPAHVPPGFEFEQGTVAIVDGRRAAILRYTNGLAAVTLVATPVPPRAMAAPEHRARRIAAGHWRVDWSGPDMDIVVMGPCGPDDLLTMVADLDAASESAFVTRMAAESGFPGRLVSAMRGSGLTRDTVHAILEIARRSGKPVETVWAYVRAGHGWQSAASRAGIPPTAIQGRLNGAR